MSKMIRPFLFLGLLASLVPSPPALAGTCTDSTCQFILCRSPASGAPSSLWGELEAVDVGQLPPERDNSNFNPITGPYNETEPRWMSLDIEGNTIFTAINFGLQVWDIGGANAGDPSRLVVLGRNSFPYWKAGFNEEKNPVRDLDAPPGNDNVLAIALVNDSGLSVFDTTNRSSPVAKYADKERNALQVYSPHIGSSDYAFLATRNRGVTAYNLTTAKNLGAKCVDNTPAQSSCGPYLGKLGSRNDVSYIDGAGNFLVFSSGAFNFGLEFYNVANPSSPQLLFTALGSDFVYGVALWQKGSNYYLGMMTNRSGGTQARIYDMSCLATGSCTAIGPMIWSQNLPGGGSEFFVTYSQGNGRDFIYIGTVNLCSQLTQNEWLYDVTNPNAPSDVTPSDGLVNGQTTGYWGWYYRRNPTGFNNTAGRVGKFKGQYFYRAAFNIFDVHQLTTSAPAANFTHSPAQIYQGEPIDFIDTSSGGPTTFAWTFQDATPATSASPDPQNVVFNSTGLKSVTLAVSNAFGSDSITQQLDVLDPTPSVASVSASPNPALICQPITFTANSVTGLAPLTLGWDVEDAGGTVATGGNVNPFIWGSTGFAAGQYTATVTVTNSSGNAMATSPSVTLNPLPALAFTSPGNAPETLNGPPFTSGLVDFQIQSTGATEWRWDFGDGTPPVWTSDPVAGPQPSHTYTTANTYSVTVEIRNCVTAALASSATSVTITNTTPLVAQFDAQGIFCNGLGCFSDTGVMITFVDMSQGNPDFYDYDWDGDGTYESIDNPAPITIHTYYTTGNFSPAVRVRRGTESDVFTHQQISISGATLPLPSISVAGPTNGEVGQPLTFTVTATNCTPAPSVWQWSVEDATISGSASGSTINLSFPTTGAKTLRATPTDGQCAGYQGTAAVSIAVSGSFIFADGFEAGDISAWSESVP